MRQQYRYPLSTIVRGAKNALVVYIQPLTVCPVPHLFAGLQQTTKAMHGNYINSTVNKALDISSKLRFSPQQAGHLKVEVVLVGRGQSSNQP